MNISKYILLLYILLGIPTFAFAQLGNKSIKLSTGDTVRVVNQRALLSQKDLDFLRKDTSKQKKILDYTSDYNSIEEAALDLDKLLDEISTSKSLSEKNNESLSVRLATRNLRNLKKEQDIQNTWDSIIAAEPPMEELKQLYKLFDGKPSYFINDVMVKPQMVERLRQNEILNRTTRTINTVTGNPNGEICYDVTPQAFRRLKIIEDNSLEPAGLLDMIEEAPVEKKEPSVSTTPSTIKSEPKIETKTKEDKKEKKRSVRKIKENRAKKYKSVN